eukprot:scaffold3566_cov119-Isochrysis_galbana.AAC.3
MSHCPPQGDALVSPPRCSTSDQPAPRTLRTPSGIGVWLLRPPPGIRKRFILATGAQLRTAFGGARTRSVTAAAAQPTATRCTSLPAKTAAAHTASPAILGMETASRAILGVKAVLDCAIRRASFSAAILGGVSQSLAAAGKSNAATLRHAMLAAAPQLAVQTIFRPARPT